MPLRDRLLRSTVSTLVIAMAVVAVPVLLVGLGYALLARPYDQHDQTDLMALGGGLLLALAGLGLGVWLAQREVDAVAAPMADLATQAEAIGRRPPGPSLHTGIDEIDAVSDVLRQRALELTQRLANEREFASDASHQLRTPLTALLIRLEEISMLDDPAEMREEAASCIDQVERLTRVVDDLLSRTPGTPAGDAPDTSLDSVLASLQVEWQPAFSRARRSVKIGGERDLRLRVRRDDLAQIISTLLENALKHGRGLVEIAASQSGPSILLEMTDEGDGVDPALAPFIFDRRVTTGGTGLGLALARDLAQSNGGRLELVQAQPARFALFLSAARAPAAGDESSVLGGGQSGR